MRLYLDIDTREFLQSPSFPRALTTLALKRRDTDLIELQFLRDRAVQELPTGTTIRLGLKPDAAYTAEFLASGTFTKSGTGTSTKYLLDLNLNTVALNAAFAAATPEPAILESMLEVEWSSASIITSSLTLPVTLHNDVIRGDEGEPAALPNFYVVENNDFRATQSEAEAGTNNNKWMSPLRVVQTLAAKISSFLTWANISDKPMTFPPSTHGHTISEINNLETSLDAKAEATHFHPLAALTQSNALLGQVATWNGANWVPQNPTGGSGGVSSWDDLTDKPETFPPVTHSHEAGDIISGVVARERLGTGSASSATFLRGDGTWATPSGGNATTDASLLTSGTLNDARLSLAVTASLVKADTASQPGHSHGAADITSGTIAAARLGVTTSPTGQTPSSSNFLRGDQVWTNSLPALIISNSPTQSNHAARKAEVDDVRNTVFTTVNASVFKERSSLTVFQGQQYTITQGRDVRLVYVFPPDASSVSIVLPRSTDGAVFGDICRVEFTTNRAINVNRFLRTGSTHSATATLLATVTSSEANNVFGFIFDGDNWQIERDYLGLPGPRGIFSGTLSAPTQTTAISIAANYSYIIYSLSTFSLVSNSTNPTVALPRLTDGARAGDIVEIQHSRSGHTLPLSVSQYQYTGSNYTSTLSLIYNIPDSSRVEFICLGTTWRLK
jgi:hypothetical protein